MTLTLDDVSRLEADLLRARDVEGKTSASLAMPQFLALAALAREALAHPPAAMGRDAHFRKRLSADYDRLIREYEEAIPRAGETFAMFVTPMDGKLILAALRDALARPPAAEVGSDEYRDQINRHGREAGGDGQRPGLELAARWHDERARNTPDAFETELHQVSARTIRALPAAPAKEPQMDEGNTPPALLELQKAYLRGVAEGARDQAAAEPTSNDFKRGIEAAADALRDLDIQFNPPTGLSVRSATVAAAQRLIRAIAAEPKP